MNSGENTLMYSLRKLAKFITNKSHITELIQVCSLVCSMSPIPPMRTSLLEVG